MGILTQVFERRFHPSQDPPTWVVKLSGWDTATGVTVTPESAMQATAVYACVRILAESVASLPLHVYRRLDEGGKERATDHYLYSILHDAPNPEMTSFELRELLMSHLALWGNAFAEIEYDNAGRVRALWPLRPDRMRVKRSNGELVYIYMLNGQEIPLSAERVFHLRGLGSDGVLGYSPIAMARQAIGLALATEEFGARFFGNGARPGIVLQHPGVLSEKARKNLRESWEERHGGLEKSHRIAILEEGMTIQEIGIPPEDAQFIQTRKFQITEIARIFRIPPHMLADLERATFSNIEHQSIEFVVHTLRPWLVRWEQAIHQRLFLPSERDTNFAEFLVDGLLRGDIKSRYDAYAVGRQWGWLSADDVREMENMNPLPDGKGKMYMVPLNMVPASGIAQEPPPEQPPQGQERSVRGGVTGAEYRAAASRRRLVHRYRRVIQDVAQRIVNRETNDIRNAARKYLAQRGQEEFYEWLTRFLNEHLEFVKRYLKPHYLTYAQLVADEVADEVDYRATDEEILEFVERYLDSSARRWVKHTRGEVERAINRAVEAGEDPLPVIEERLDQMREKRAGKVADVESTKLNNATARAVYTAAGIMALKWVTFGDSCPYCTNMNGRTIGIRDLFVAAGTQYHPDGADVPLVPKFDVRHPPLHQGCDCMIVASIM